MEQKIKYKIKRVDRDIFEVIDISDGTFYNSSYIVEKIKLLDRAILHCFSTTELQELRNKVELELEKRLRLD